MNLKPSEFKLESRGNLSAMAAGLIARLNLVRRRAVTQSRLALRLHPSSLFDFMLSNGSFDGEPRTDRVGRPPADSLMVDGEARRS